MSISNILVDNNYDIKAGSFKVKGALYDSLGSAGNNNDMLLSTVTGTKWTAQTEQEHMIFMNSNGATLINDTYIGINGYSTNVEHVKYTVVNNMNVTKIIAKLNTPPGTNNAWNIIIQKNGIDTAFFLSIAGAETSGFIQGSALLNAGDDLSVHLVKSGSAASVGQLKVTLAYI